MDIKTQANLIKVGAVLTAIPRWVTALLWAEGFALPAAWVWWWVPVSALLSVAMAAVEGFAFAFAFSVWASRKKAHGLLFAALLTAALFVGVLTPSIAAGVRGVPIGDILTHDGVLLLWSVSVAASTIGIVISVGYAQRIGMTDDAPESAQSAPRVRVLAPERAALAGAALPALPAGAPDDAPEDWPVAGKRDWLRIHAGLNGDGANMDAGAIVALLAEYRLRPPKRRTVQAWAQETQDSARDALD